MSGQPPIFQVKDLTKIFYGKPSTLWGKPKIIATALDRVSLSIAPGEVVGLAGESGSGKTTLAQILCGLETPTAGQALYDGKDLARMSNEERVAFRRQVQMVFQDPYESLNPRHTVFRTVSEPLLNAGIRSRGQLTPRVTEALEQAGIRPASVFFDTYPHQLSGGQRQRVSIARAIVLKPRVLIADEPISMLDVSLRAGILNLLRRLRETMGLTILYISHDLSTMAYLCDRIAILYRGVLKEVSSAEDILTSPRDPYTQALLAAIPSLLTLQAA